MTNDQFSANDKLFDTFVRFGIAKRESVTYNFIGTGFVIDPRMVTNTSASIYIDGARVGNVSGYGTFEVSGLSFGYHTVQIRK
jgi:hypothetical protein